MPIVRSQRHLLLRGFGYGVFSAEIVPPELSPAEKLAFRNGDRKKTTEELQRRIRKSGLLKIQEILPDPEDPEKAVLVLGEGQSPCKIEIDQLSEHQGQLETVAEANPGSRLEERLQMLREASGR